MHPALEITNSTFNPVPKIAGLVNVTEKRKRKERYEAISGFG